MNDPLEIRRYGDSGSTVILLHGGPAAPGSMAGLGRELGDEFRVLEPFQRGAGDEPLTVARHVADLQGIVEAECAPDRPALIGSSWGAMLALAHAAQHPGQVSSLVLVGCGTFDPEARKRFQDVFRERSDPALKQRIARLAEEIEDRSERLMTMGELIQPLYNFDPKDPDLEVAHCDGRAHHETWSDMLRLQREGVYPAAFAAIEEPVLMLHGSFDPHPGAMIRDSLKPFIPQLEYHEFAECGHYPWVERAARDEFLARLRTWLRSRAS